MKFYNLISVILFTGFLKINAQDCDIVKNILKRFEYEIDEAGNCCNYSVNDQYAVTCNGNSVTSFSMINNAKVNDVPDEILNLKNLEKLDLSNCLISQFPYKLKNLPNLKYLYLWKNGITEVTNEITNLKTLQHLDLGENGLTSIPDNIGQITTLNSLLLYNNEISTLPKSIFQLNQLKTINLEGNQNLSGSLMSFGNKADLCNIKNTHLCIDDKNSCGKFIVNNNDNLPYCRPESFNYSDAPSFSFIYIVIGITGIVLIATVSFLIYRKKAQKAYARSIRMKNEALIMKAKREMDEIEDDEDTVIPKDKKSKGGKHVIIKEPHEIESFINNDDNKNGTDKSNNVTIDIKPAIKNKN